MDNLELIREEEEDDEEECWSLALRCPNAALMSELIPNWYLTDTQTIPSSYIMEEAFQFDLIDIV